MAQGGYTTGPGNRAAMSARGFSVPAILALLAGVVSVATIPISSPVSPGLGVVAVILGLVSRRILRADAALRGSGLSLAGFLLGLVALAPQAVLLVVVGVGAALRAFA